MQCEVDDLVVFPRHLSPVNKTIRSLDLFDLGADSSLLVPTSVDLVPSYGREDLLNDTTPALHLVTSGLTKITTALARSMTSAIAWPTGWSAFGEVVLLRFFGLGVAGLRGWDFADGNSVSWSVLVQYGDD